MKFILKEELENFYNLQRGNSVDELQSVYATNAKSVSVSKLSTNFIIAVEQLDTNDVSVFCVPINKLDTNYTMMVGDDYVDVFLTVSPSIYEKGAVAFLDFSLQKKFSTWLFNIDKDIYITMTSNTSSYFTQSSFIYKFSVKELYLFYQYSAMNNVNGFYQVTIDNTFVLSPFNPMFYLLSAMVNHGAASIYVETEDGAIPYSEIMTEDGINDISVILASQRIPIELGEDKETMENFVEWCIVEEDGKDFDPSGISIYFKFDSTMFRER